MQLEEVIEKISSHELFKRLKNVVENGTGWHDNEPVYDHLIKVKDTALIVREGNFISDETAKDLFGKWMAEDIFGMKRSDVVVLTALVHDTGKILSYKEDGVEKTLVTKKPTTEDQNMCPGHEYYGGTIVVPKILKDLGFETETAGYISKIITQHDALSSGYFVGKEAWSIEELVSDIKARAEGYYMESLFNMYCDGYTAPAFESGKSRVEQVFSTSSFYNKRTYFIP